MLETNGVKVHLPWNRLFLMFPHLKKH